MEQQQQQQQHWNQVWILRDYNNSNTNGGNVVQDFISAVRFNQYKYNVQNLKPGRYHLYCYCARDAFFHEREWGTNSSSSSSPAVIGYSGDPLQHLQQVEGTNEEITSGDDHPTSSSTTSNISEGRVSHAVRMGVGGIFKGTRKVVETVTLGKVGAHIIHVKILLFNGNGVTLQEFNYDMTPDQNPTIQQTFEIKDTSNLSSMFIEFASSSTVTPIRVFSSLYNDVDLSSKKNYSDTRKASSSVIGKNSNTQIRPGNNKSAFDEQGQDDKTTSEGGGFSSNIELYFGSSYESQTLFLYFVFIFIGLFIGYFGDPVLSKIISVFTIFVWCLRFLGGYLFIHHHQHEE